MLARCSGAVVGSAVRGGIGPGLRGLGVRFLGLIRVAFGSRIRLPGRVEGGYEVQKACCSRSPPPAKTVLDLYGCSLVLFPKC